MPANRCQTADKTTPLLVTVLLTMTAPAPVRLLTMGLLIALSCSHSFEGFFEGQGHQQAGQQPSGSSQTSPASQEGPAVIVLLPLLLGLGKVWCSSCHHAPLDVTLTVLLLCDLVRKKAHLGNLS